MVVVAVAGGAGHLGRTLVEVLKTDPKHRVVVLGRKVPDTNDVTAPVIPVDYSDVAGTAKVLADNGVETIISAIHIMDEVSSAAQVNLIKAAAQAGSAKRFIASEWGPSHSPESHVYPLRQAGFAELRKTDLEWTRFENGYMLDYYGPSELKSYMKRMAFIVDIENRAAGIPGTGNEPMTFTYSFDIARFVLAFLNLPKWEETTYCYGDQTTWNEFLELVQAVRGSKFTVSYDSIETLKKGEVTELPSHVNVYRFFPKERLQGMLALLALYVAEGRLEVPAEKALNAVFPDIQTKKVKDVLEMWIGH